ncbi:hypothetical protein ACW5EG_16950 [Luteimonas sp. A611]
MKILRQLLLVEIAALLALLIVAGAMSAYGAADAARHADSLLAPAASAKVLFGYTMIIGFLPVVVIGAPGYVALLRKHLARWPYALGLGVLPGLLVLPFELSLGFWAIICGAAVALLTHVMCRRLGPNNSFKPTPLRGAA